MALMGKYVLIGEGARGSLAKQLMHKFALDHNREPQKFGIGLKELWEVEPENHRPGLVQHSFGWPLDCPHRRRLVPLPFRRQPRGRRLRRPPQLQEPVPFALRGIPALQDASRRSPRPSRAAKRISYGARAITEGGFQSVPQLAFPGGALVGCSAGFVNVPRIKGSHNAMLSGMLAAEHVAEALKAGRSNDTLEAYEAAWRDSEIGRDLKRVRNVKPLWSKFGTFAGIALGGLDMWTNSLAGFSLFGTLKHGKADCDALDPAAMHKPIDYPKPDGVLTFDRLSSVFLSNTNHEEDQPVHLQVKDMYLQKRSELEEYAGPSQRYCPAGVYEWVEEDGRKTFVINAQNCVHCKTCDIKDPNQNIDWVPPQGGEGPVYQGM